jgi:rubrerythrin
MRASIKIMNISDMNEAERRKFDEWYKRNSFMGSFDLLPNHAQQEALKEFDLYLLKSDLYSSKKGRKNTQQAWECPACGVGVRGDVEVCPNCVKNKTEFKVTIQEAEIYGKGIGDSLLEQLRKIGVGRA